MEDTDNNIHTYCLQLTAQDVWLGHCSSAVWPLQRSERLEVVPTAGGSLLMYPLHCTALSCLLGSLHSEGTLPDFL